MLLLLQQKKKHSSAFCHTAHPPIILCLPRQLPTNLARPQTDNIKT
jgi:hypothetical protein